MKNIHTFCLPFIFFSALTAAAQIDAHFIFLAKHPKHADKNFILLERREHLWELPHVKAKADELRTDAGLLESVLRATFKMVLVDPNRVAKFDNGVREMVFVASSLREANPLLLEHELNRLNAMNPDVHELRWVEYTATAFANENSFVDGQCLGLTDQISPCGLALNSFTTKVLSDKRIQTSIDPLLFNVARGAEPSVTPRHFMIASEYKMYEQYWYFVADQNGSYVLPQVPDVKSSKDYPAMVKQHFQLDFQTGGNMYTELSNSHKDVRTGKYYSDIFHVHSAKYKLPSASKGSLLCRPSKISQACQSTVSSEMKCIDENGVEQNVEFKNFDHDMLCPLVSSKSFDHRMNFLNGSRTAGTLLVRTVNNKRYSLFMSLDNANGGWAVPSGHVDYPEDYGSDHDPLLVGALRKLEEKSSSATKLDIDRVEKECTTISKATNYGAIERYQICHVDNNLAFSSGEITVKDYCRWPGNIRWICLDDIIEFARTWNASSPFVVKAETLRDADSTTYFSNYRIYDESISFLVHGDFQNALMSAIVKDGVFNSAFMEYPINFDISTHAGALMLDSATGKIGFAKNETGKPFIPLSDKINVSNFTYPRFTNKGSSIGVMYFSVCVPKVVPEIFPILNYDTVENNIGVSRNIVLHEKSNYSVYANEKIEWIGVDEIANHPSLSAEDKAIFADPSCQESLNYWIAFYKAGMKENSNSSNNAY